MKEFSVEQKAKCYDEALERARNLHKDAVDMGENLRAKQCEIIFPELKENENEDEDEKIRKWLISQLKIKSDDTNSDLNVMIDKSIDWLESLKDRVQPQSKQEWSKEDENAINDIMWIIEAYRENSFNEIHKQTANNAERWLKSLRPQNTWKPSDKQINAVRLARSFVTDDFGENPTLSDVLVELEKQLEKIINL